MTLGSAASQWFGTEPILFYVWQIFKSAVALFRLQFSHLQMRELAKITASPPETLAPLVSDFAYRMCNFVDYGIIHTAHAHARRDFIGYVLETQAPQWKDAEG